ncbi:hypothetical protein [Planococcus sp. NCCP-2050]|uniref:hypothetical protein n=1 Tax=Planococcus sp. NCCP-2050 TaxID=2944679 RepID=UPI00203FF14B|nr:hypothetical protein [Planococcus sp. NCCP-2050]GKW46434.1 hypothetical protein NCCP2050_21260 [Planococcus sp. NCCP-2050]
MNPLEIQYNGIVLLYGYLQRLFVYGKVKSMLGAVPETLEIDSLPSLLDKTSEIFQHFDTKNGLSKEQQQELLAILATVKKLMPHTVEKTEKPELADQLAVAGAALYAEEYINNGIIHLGMLFNPTIADRFRQHIPHFQNRVNGINSFVDKAANGKSLSTDELAQLDTWYTDVMKNAANIPADFQSIYKYIDTKV